ELPTPCGARSNRLERGDRFFGGRRDDLRQRREVERGTESLTLRDGVGQELLEVRLLRRAVRHDRVGEGRDRVGTRGLLRRVRDADRVARRERLHGRGSFFDVFQVRELEVPGLVFDRGDAEGTGGDQVRRRDVADRALGLG